MSRLPRMLASLIVLWACYWLYSLLVVPLVEPQAVARPTRPAPAPQPEPETQTWKWLQSYLPPDSPELNTPIVLETPNFVLLMKDYETIAERQLQIKPCTLIFFPDGVSPAANNSARVIVMRAPGGALLDFDEECDLTRAKVGKLLGGRLVGEVTIEGDLASDKSAGAASYLHISTRDVQLNQQRIWTPHDVKLQLGNNRGSGSDMQIILAAPQSGQRKGRQAAPRGIESFQLLRDVRLAAQLGEGLVPAPKGTPLGPVQPMEISCQGAFRFDMNDYVATFENQVDVKRVHPTGPADSLSCELLAIHFAKAADPDLTSLKPHPGSLPLPHAVEGKAGLSAIQRARAFSVTTIEARGNPVVVHAVTPQGEAEARGEHLQYDVATGGVLLASEENVALRIGPQEIVSKIVRYTPTPDGLSAEALAEGPGTFQGALPGDPTKQLSATWTRQLSIRPHEGKQLLSVLGEAKLQYAELGSLSGEEIWLWLAEDPGQAMEGRAGGVSPPVLSTPGTTRGLAPPARLGNLRYRPHSLLCRGKVRIDSPQFGGQTEQLEVWFQPGGAVAETPTAAGNAVPLPSPSRATIGPRYELAGRLTRVQFVLVGNQPVLRDVSLSGAVSLQETPAPGSTERPLSLAGEEVQLMGADSNNTTLSVIGQPARVEARGLGLSGANIRYDKAASRLWIDGQGELTFLVPGGALGDPSAAAAPVPQVAAGAPAIPVGVQFAKGLNFDGHTARFDGPVVVRSAERQLNTPQLLVRLSEPIELTRPKTNRQPQLEQIACLGGVLMENRTRDAAGNVTSIDRLQTNDLTIKQPSGDITARGAGWASTTRLGKAAALPGPLAGRAAPAAPAAGAGDKLTHVRIRFEQGITGNVNRRELTFADQIACIYSPVTDWNTMVDPPRASDLTADQLLLSCDKLTANDLGGAGAPAADGGANIELQALGNARIDAQKFTAEGDRLIYSAGKQLLTLEGSGQADAHLWQKGPNGESTSHAAARKILYWRATNRVQVQDIRNIDLNQLGWTR